MKKELIRAASASMAVMMAVTMPYTAMAAEHDAYDNEDIWEAVAYDDDEVVTINLKCDIEDTSFIYPHVGTTYYINGQSYTLADVYVQDQQICMLSATESDPTVGESADAADDSSDETTININADMTGTLSVYDGYTVNVDGSIDAEDSYEGVHAEGKSTVNVTGDVKGDYYGVYDSGSTVNVGGSVSGEVGVSASNGGTWTEDGYEESKASVTVGKDVTGASVGVEARGDAEVEVGGDVTGTEDYSTGVIADGGEDGDEPYYTSLDADEVGEADEPSETTEEKKATVKVEGNVTAGEYGVVARNNAEVEVKGDVTATSEGSYGVYAEGKSEEVPSVEDEEVREIPAETDLESTDEEAESQTSVTVGGNVKAEYVGVDAENNAEVEVKGDVAATEEYSYGVWASNGASVDVGGDVESGYEGVGAAYEGEVNVDGSVTATSDDAYGVYAGNGSTVTVGEDVAATSEDSTGVYAENGSNVTVGNNVSGGESGYYANGIEMDNTSTVEVGNDVSSAGDTVIMTLVFVPQDDEEAQYLGSLKVNGVVSSTEDGNAVSILSESDEVDDALANLIEDADTLDTLENLNELSNMTDEEMKDVTFEDLLNAYAATLSGLLTLNENGFIDDFDPDIDKFGDNLEKFITKLLTATNLNDKDEVSEEELIDAFDAIPDEERVQFVKDFSDILDELLAPVIEAQKEAVSDDMPDYKIADITIYGLEAESEDKLYTVEDLEYSQELTDLFMYANTSYLVKTEKAENGTVTADIDTAMIGDTIHITATPNAGYHVKKVTVAGNEVTAVDGTYSYTVEGPDDKDGFLDVVAEFEKDSEPAVTPTVTPTKTTTTTTPKTGDTNSILAWGIALLTAVGAMLTALRRKERD